MKTKTTSRHSLSLVFLMLLLIMLYLGSNFSMFTPSVEANELVGFSSSGQDFSMTRVLKFVVDMVAYSL